MTKDRSITLASDFTHTCEKMCETLATLTVDKEAWDTLEAAALKYLHAMDTVDHYAIHKAVFMSGSGPLMKLAWDMAPQEQQVRFIETKGISISYGVVRNLSLDDIAWLNRIGLKHQVRSCCLRDCMMRDSPEYIDLLARMYDMPKEAIILKALEAIPGNLPQQNALAEPIAETLRNLRYDPEGINSLCQLLSGALGKTDIRLISAILSLGASLPEERLNPPKWLADPLRSLLGRMSSHHGRLLLICREPSTTNILKRHKDDPFHGVTQDEMG
jgi:hypothetical protein